MKFLIILLLLCVPAFAAGKHDHSPSSAEIEKQVEVCIEEGDASTGKYLWINCNAIRRNDDDRKLNEYYKELMTAIAPPKATVQDKEIAALLLTAQRKWLEYLDAEFAFIALLLPGGANAGVADIEESALTHDRSLELAAYIDIYQIDYLYLSVPAHGDDGNDATFPSNISYAEKFMPAYKTIEPAFTKCLNTKAKDKNSCEIEHLTAWDKELNKYYKELMAALGSSDFYDDNTKAALLSAQRKWLAYRDAELAFSDKLFDFMGESHTGEPYTMTKLKRRTDKTFNRAIALHGYWNIIDQ